MFSLRLFVLLSTLLGACSPFPATDPVQNAAATIEPAASVTNDEPTAANTSTEPATNEDPMTASDASQHEIATLGAGCFWCVEAVLQQVDGVIALRSGFMGGHTDNPTYRDICTGTTGHAEVVEVTFDPAVIGYDEILVWFWQLHDPTTLNRQGADVGTQYRSAIFVHSDEQRKVAEASLKQYDASDMYDAPFVTEISDASEFFVADEYHQDYYRQNKNQGYCHMVIAPKLKKLGLEH